MFYSIYTKCGAGAQRRVLDVLLCFCVSGNKMTVFMRLLWLMRCLAACAVLMIFRRLPKFSCLSASQHASYWGWGANCWMLLVNLLLVWEVIHASAPRRTISSRATCTMYVLYSYMCCTMNTVRSKCTYIIGISRSLCSV